MTPRRSRNGNDGRLNHTPGRRRRNAGTVKYRGVPGHPPVVSFASSWTWQPLPSASSSQPSGSTTRARGEPWRPRGVPSSPTGNGSFGSRSASSRSSVGEAVDQAERAAHLAAGGEALEVPRDVLAELLAAPLLPHVLAQQLGVPAHHRGHLAERRQGRDLLAGERRGQVAEDPRPAQAAAPDDDAGGAGLLDHPHRVGGLPDVAVAEHRDVDVVDQRARSRPSRPRRSRPAPRSARAARSPRSRLSWAIRPASR